MSNGINVLSLCDGISCGKVALDRVGIKVNKYFSSEIDENAIAISKKNHDDIIYLGDITKWRNWDLPHIDLVLSGSPCKGFTRGGLMRNFKDPQSRVFFDFVDILNDIKTKNPDVLFLFENVKMKDVWKDTITNNLGVEPIEINSKLMSAQNRWRTYWTNIHNVEKPKDKGIKLLDILEDNPDVELVEHKGIMFDSYFPDNAVAIVNRVNGELRINQATKMGYIVAHNGDGVNLSFPTSKTRRGRVINQKSSTLDCACNASVYYDNTIRRLTCTELERLQTLPDGYTDGLVRSNRVKAIGNGWTVDVIAWILSFMKQ